MTNKLAIDGGTPVRSTPFPAYRTIGQEEKAAVAEVMDSGVLSAFLGTWSPEFLGGPRVRKLEDEWASYFAVKHAVSMNSATSGLFAALGAAGVGPGDEVIVSPYTMTASAVGPLIYNAIPVFADIDASSFCLTAETIRARLTPRTRAVIVVDLFGYPAEMDAIMRLAREHDFVVIEDAAQAPGATRNGRYAGTLGHIGIFSLNYHKHIHSGEGAVVVTDDDRLAERLQLIRNHAEVVIQTKGADADLNNMLGFNYRMTEIEAAIASEQLKKLSSLLNLRINRVNQLTGLLGGIDGISLPLSEESNVKHAYYLYTMRYHEESVGVPRADIVKALSAEGVPVSQGYVQPIYLQPLYQKKVLFGGTSSPWEGHGRTVDYTPGICPVVEKMHYSEVLFTNLVHAQTGEEDVKDIAEALWKVMEFYSRAGG